MTKRTTYKLVCLFLAALVFFGASILLISDDYLVAEAYCLENETHADSSLSPGHHLRPTREEIKEMEENAEKIMEEKRVKPIVIILCVLVFIVGLLMLLYPDFFIELSFFKYNQRNYWFGRGYTINPTNAVRIFTRIIGVFLMLTPFISCILVYVIS